MQPRDDIRDNPFKSYDFYKGYCPDDIDPDYCPDDLDADDWGVDTDYIYDNLTGK